MLTGCCKRDARRLCVDFSLLGVLDEVLAKLWNQASSMTQYVLVGPAMVEQQVTMVSLATTL